MHIEICQCLVKVNTEMLLRKMLDCGLGTLTIGGCIFLWFYAVFAAVVF